MQHHTTAIRPFIGAKDYDLSRRFYSDLGFQENVISDTMSYFSTENIGFYLQRAYVKDWVDNTMIFMEVADIEHHWAAVNAMGLPAKYAGVRVSGIQNLDWGREYFVHDPSGILWHIGVFH